jgi:hypothetical protein
VRRGFGVVLCLLVTLGAGHAAAVAVHTKPAAGLAATAAAHASGPPPAELATAVFDPSSFAGADAKLAFARAREAGASVARLNLSWLNVAPSPLPASSNPFDPRNPGYHWEELDRQVELAANAGLQPMLSIFGPPAWARKPAGGGSTVLPELQNFADVGSFALAAAKRYSGSFGRLPRVRYWEVWNEPNLSAYLAPQYSGGVPASPAIYRKIVNAVAAAVHSVHPDNVVVAGGTSPFGKGDATTDPTRKHVVIGPMEFMRAFLCMSAGPRPKPTCKDRVAFDVWSHHPYTAGGPRHHAIRPGDVSLGDLPQMKALLDAAVKAGHVRSRDGVRFWITEFSWDSKPPDPGAVPVTLEAQWISEAIYRMWRTGISLVTWFLIRDDAHFQSGLYFAGPTLADDRPKPALTAFRFPFVGHMVNRNVAVWGRTPSGKPGRVLVEESRSGTSGWTPLGVVATGPHGIFTRTFGLTRTFATTRGAYVRARVLGSAFSTVPFPLAGPPDLAVQPFGS